MQVPGGKNSINSMIIHGIFSYNKNKNSTIFKLIFVYFINNVKRNKDAGAGGLEFQNTYKKNKWNSKLRTKINNLLFYIFCSGFVTES
jgi:hypothetical protein